MDKYAGGQAFPRLISSLGDGRDREISGEQSGMTVRQFYKAAAMQGILSNPSESGDQLKLAEWSGKIADAMIQEDVEAAK